MVFKFLSDIAARGDEALAQADAQSLVARIEAVAANPAIPSAEHFANSVLGSYAHTNVEAGHEVMSLPVLSAFHRLIQEIYTNELAA